MRIIAGFLLTIAVLLPPAKSYASHAMGTDITYECLGNGEYKITVAFYRDCSGINAPASIVVDYFSASCSIAAGSLTETLGLQDSQEVSPLCPRDLPTSSCHPGGTRDGVERYIYSGIITLPLGCSDWIVGYSECCRNSQITNLVSAASYNLYAYAQINNTGGICNNSPVFTTTPVPFICPNTLFNYNQGAVDPDGDSLVYRMIPPNDDYQVAIPYDGSFTVNYPMSTTTLTFQFDSTTGQMSMTPDGWQYAVITVQVEEYRNGTLVGSTMRDIQIVVIDPDDCSNSPPVITQSIANLSGGGLLDSSTIQMCPNTPLSFDMVLTDPNGDSIFLSSNATTAIPGSNFTVIGGGSNVIGRFSWVPSLADTGFHPFQVTYLDNGCPISTPQTVTYVIFVFDRVIASADQVYCGDSIQLNAYGGSVFSWSPALGLSATNKPNPKAAPSVPTMYYVTSDCNRTDSVFVDVQPPYTLDAGRDTTTCLNSIAQLQASVNPATYGPYSYSWNPIIGLDDPNISNPTAQPPDTTAYVLTSFSAQGCIRQDTVIVNIFGVAPNVTAFADPANVCVGETTQLELTVRPSACNITSQPCDNTPIDFTVGTGTRQTSASVNGTPYKGSFEDERVQYLYRASELNALGITGGTITQIAFNISAKRSTVPFNNFTIKIGCTSLSFLPAFDSGLTTVYGPTAYTTSPGWNIHALTSFYEWDGISNLIIQVCYDNNTLFNSLNDDVFFTPTTFSSVAYNYDDLQSGCSLVNSDTVTYRPNTRFTVCSRSLSNAVVDWTLSFGNSLISDASIPDPTAQVFETTRYIANVSMGDVPGRGP